MKEFVPKKTLTVQLPVDIIRKFEELCQNLNVAKSQMIKIMIEKEVNQGVLLNG